MSDDLETLPAGYVTFQGVSVHVAKLRQHTTDIRRLLRMLPFAEELAKHTPGSPGALEFIRTLTADERKALALTMHDLGHFQIALAAELTRETDERERRQ